MKNLWLILWVVASVGMESLGAKGEEARPAPEMMVQLTPAEQAWIKAHPQVRWGADPEWPPFSSRDRNGQLVGIDSDITRLVAARLGLQLTEVEAKTWPEMLAKANAGVVDFLSATGKTPERSGRFDFTEHYGSFPIIIISADDAPFLMPPQNLESLTVAAARDDAVTWQLKKDYPTVHFILEDTAEQCLDLVARKKADVTVQNLAVACHLIRVNGLTDLKICGITRYELPIHFAVRKDAPELVSILNKGLATITPAEQERIYAKHLTPDIGKSRDWALWRKRAIYGALIGASIISLVLIWNTFLEREIQRRKMAEAALSDARGRLERHTQELALRIKEVEQLNTELTSANQNLESFSGSVSHDLRAPLRRMIGFAELLGAEAGDSLTKVARDRLDVIVSESTRMDRLIYDLLEFARLGREELHKQPVDMMELVKGVIDDFHTQLRERAVVWKIGDLCEVLGDPNLLRYALINLVDNALKYTRRRPEARITIDISPERSSQREITFYVKDNGSGFDMNKARKLFDPFQRLHSSSEFEGTGMGLANVHKIIQKHGGRIWFESELNKGATFYFTLPRSQGSRQPPSVAARMQPAEDTPHFAE